MTGAAVEPESFTINDDTKRSWWARRTILERRLLILLVVLLVIAVAMVIVVAITSAALAKSRQQSPVSDGPTKCLTQDCVVTAAEMLEAMNTSADPVR
ncbi:hypothetical protein LSAT2_027024 [Lamellibrachia satsuma]|nr:hypothetical protein LSAT2_027024 [Lamellibrachia satsuma]